MTNQTLETGTYEIIRNQLFRNGTAFATFVRY
jgi:hypothetical protein